MTEQQSPAPETAAVDADASNTGTRPVASQHAFDVDRLVAWLAPRVAGWPGGSVSVEQFKGGQSNPTFLLSVGANDGDGNAAHRYVMRRKPPGDLLPSAHAIDREFRLISALAGTDVPVAKAHVYCDDASVIGSAFYLMDHVDGRIFWDPRLPGVPKAERAALYSELNRAMAALHSVDPAAVGLADYGKPGNYVERQVARWSRQYVASETEKIVAADHLMAWLPQHLPAQGQTRIVHGDYRFDNVIFHPTEPRIVAVLDWELSTLGDPLVDFAYHCMRWHLDAGSAGGLAGADLAELGIPSEADYLQTYLHRTGRSQGVPAAEWTYYIVFNMFRLVGILQGVAKRAQQGNAASERAVQAGRRTRPLAEQAWALAQTL